MNGQDARQVYEVTRQLVERLRAGEGPAFLICDTYRFHGHHVGDIDRGYYRSKEEELTWTSERDPLTNLSDWLTTEGLADEQILDSIEADTKTEIEKALEFALATPYPDPGEVDKHVYA